MRKLFNTIWKAVKRFFGWFPAAWRARQQRKEVARIYKEAITFDAADTSKEKQPEPWTEEVKLIYKIWERAQEIYKSPGFNWQEKNNWLTVHTGGRTSILHSLDINGYVLEYEKDPGPERNAFNFYSALQDKVVAVTPKPKAAGSKK